MKKIIIAISLAILGLIILIYFFVKFSNSMYFPIIGKDSSFYYLFNDTIQQKLRKTYSYSNTKDSLFAYNYKNDYQFVIWEIDAFNKVNFNKIKIIQNKFISKFNYNPYSKVEFSSISLISVLPFLKSKNLIFTFDNKSKVLNIEQHSDYCSILCNLNEVDISNELGRSQIRITKKEKPRNCNLIFYQYNENFYLIIMCSINGKKVETENLKSFFK